MKCILSFRWEGVRHRLAFPSKLKAELVGSILVGVAKPAEIGARVTRAPVKEKKPTSRRKVDEAYPDSWFVHHRARAFSVPAGESFIEDDVIIDAGGKRLAEILVHEEFHGWEEFLAHGQNIEPVACATPHSWEE
jgi:hypothetical protein